MLAVSQASSLMASVCNKILCKYERPQWFKDDAGGHLSLAQHAAAVHLRERSHKANAAFIQVTCARCHVMCCAWCGACQCCACFAEKAAVGVQVSQGCASYRAEKLSLVRWGSGGQDEGGGVGRRAK